MIFFVNTLTLWTWAVSVWPRLILSRLGQGPKVSRCYVMDGSRFAFMVSKVSAKFAGATVERLRYRIPDMRDDSGQSIRLRLTYDDLAEVQRSAMAEPAFLELFGNGLLVDRSATFLAKSLASVSRSDPSNIFRALNLVQACSWKKTQDENMGSAAILFLERRPWLGAIKRYASQYGIDIVPVRPTVVLLSVLRRCLPPRIIEVLRDLRYHQQYRWARRLLRDRATPKPMDLPAAGLATAAAVSSQERAESMPRVGVEYYGMLHLNQPERHSDLFFWQRSALKGSDVLLTLSFPSFRLSAQDWADLREHSMETVLLHPGAAGSPSMPVFKHRRSRSQPGATKLSVKGKGPERDWLNRQLAKYQAVREFWTDLCSSYNLKVYVTWYKFDEIHCAIADALQSTGGVTAIYQRAYEAHSASHTTISSDIVFGFSQDIADIERRSNSNIRYHVTTGYIGDHRFELVRASAKAVRDRLEQHGAKRILAYLDENTAEDPRWTNGHYVTQNDYAFLLEKVLAEPWLGLVIKPKASATLRRRLGPVTSILEAAESTGRCYVFDAHDTANQGWNPPAEAALAADITIHSHLSSATAGMEAALAGAPTLLLDTEGWSRSPLYRLGLGAVVFTDWDTLWNACQQHWSTPKGIPGFGDWRPMLDHLDPFRDGRAADRMGTYIQWLIEGFKSGLDRETVMSNAAERYCTNWGSDKITEVDGGFQPMVATGMVKDAQSLGPTSVQ